MDEAPVMELSVMTDAETSRRRITLNESLFVRNDELAARNRARFQAAGAHVVNVMSSPGSGKTALLSRTMADLRLRGVRCACIVGDLATDNDGRRLRASGAPTVQIMTGGDCHLEAAAVARAAEQIDLLATDALFIENVGNLVCPSGFDLGEDRRVVLFSVTEGEDKPLKYPSMFKRADLILITKVDLADAVDFKREDAWAAVRSVAPQADILEVSSKTGAGMSSWYDWLSRASGPRR